MAALNISGLSKYDIQYLIVVICDEKRIMVFDVEPLAECNLKDLIKAASNTDKVPWVIVGGTHFGFESCNPLLHRS